MDLDTGTLIQNIPADELIKANGQAEARELSKTRERLLEAEDMMQEIRRVNLKNIELQEKISAQLSEIESLTAAARLASEEARTAAGQAREVSEKVLEIGRREEEKVSGMEKSLTSTLKEGFEAVNIKSDLKEALDSISIPDPGEDIKKLGSSLEEVIHREDVKVYKNVQASMEKALEDQNENLSGKIIKGVEDAMPDTKVLLFFVILSFIASAANLTIWILDYLGYIIH